MERIRVGTLQYFIRPVRTFEQFQEQVEALVETAADYHCHLLVFPEYFTVQLLTLGNVRRPIREQVRDLARQAERVTELLAGLARRHGLYIVGGTIPVAPEGGDQVFNQSTCFGPGGGLGHQRKLHMTRFETEDWIVSPGSALRVFETAFGRIAIAICYDVEFPELARAAASHSGERVHLDGAAAILALAGLDATALRTPADYPLDPVERDAWVCAGRAPEPIGMNCSGKHAAMLLTCVLNGWPTDGYRAPDHPLQVGVRAHLERLSGEEVGHIGIDGCGAQVRIRAPAR